MKGRRPRAGRGFALAAAFAVALGTAAEAEGAGAAGEAGRVLPATPYEFPRDHFAHPSFDSEWWYYTGNLFTAGGRHFGFELTFFRRAREIEVAEPSAWDLDQVWLAHFTITDTREERFVVDERINRSGPGVAGADASKRRIWNGNWSIGWRPGDENRPTQVLTAMNRDASLRLTLTPAKPVVIHGRDGVSRKIAGDPRAVSHYLSFTRLAAAGTVSIGGDELAVTGLAWMDHEFFSDYPLEDKVGWDWMSIQLEDGVDLMLFGLRDASGGHGPDTTGTLVEAHGEARRIEWGRVRLRPGRSWAERGHGRGIPGRVGGRDSALALRLDVRPRIDGQEVHTEGGLLPAYWEGAVVVSGEREGRPVSGVGYLEMTGYAERFALGTAARGAKPLADRGTVPPAARGRRTSDCPAGAPICSCIVPAPLLSEGCTKRHDTTCKAPYSGWSSASSPPARRTRWEGAASSSSSRTRSPSRCRPRSPTRRSTGWA